MSGLLTLLTTALAVAAFTAIVIATVALARDRRLDVRRGLSVAALTLVAAGAVTVGIANTLPAPESGAPPAPAPVSVVDVQLPTLALGDE